MLEDLFKRARDGDRRAEGELFRELYVRFVRLAGHRLGRDEAEDAAQRACITIHQKYRSEAITVSYSAWAYGVFRNTAVREMEKGSRQRARHEPVENLDQLAARPEPHPLLPGWILECFKAILKRHPRYARILNLRRQGFKTDEVCQRVGVTAEQFYVYLNRGRTMLRSCLNERGVSL